MVLEITEILNMFDCSDAYSYGICDSCLPRIYEYSIRIFILLYLDIQG